RQRTLPDHGARFRLPFRRARRTGRYLNMTGRIFLKLIAGVFCLLLLALVPVVYFATKVAQDNYIQNLTAQLPDRVRVRELSLDAPQTLAAETMGLRAGAAGGGITVVRADGKVL